MEKIVILGAGFAALTAIKQLRKTKVNAEIVLVAPQPQFAYLPSVIWVPYGLRSREDLTFDLQVFFREHQVIYVQAEVTRVTQASRTVHTSIEEISYDYLLIATGGRFIKKAKGIAEHVIIPCEGIAAGEKIKARLQAMDSGAIVFGFSGNPNEPSAMRGGPMFEFMFGVDTWLRQQGRREKFQLSFVSPAKKPGQRLGERAVKGLLKEMQKREIRPYLGAKIAEFGADFVRTETDTVSADLTLFIPGMTGPAWLQESDLPLSPGGFAKANAEAKVAERVYVAGDAGSFPGPDWRPKQAHMADLQAAAAVKNIQAALTSKPANHTFKTELICIVDTLDSGILVFRNNKFNILLKSRFFHTAKKWFEKLYLRGMRH